MIFKEKLELKMIVLGHNFFGSFVKFKIQNKLIQLCNIINHTRSFRNVYKDLLFICI